MERNVGLANGYLQKDGARKENTKQWQNLTRQLNAFGPPIRSEKEWKRVSLLVVYLFLLVLYVFNISVGLGRLQAEYKKKA